jgi:hypothetical protein
MSIVTNTVISQQYVQADIATVVATFDRLRWYRGRSGRLGAFEPATAATVQPAVLTATKTGPHDLEGTSLVIRSGGVEETFTFATSGAYTTAAVRDLINATAVRFTASVVGDKLRVTTTATGTSAALEVVGGDAAPELGLLVGAAAIGLGADTALVSTQHEYSFVDTQSAEDFWYRVEFRSSTGPQVALLSAAFASAIPQGVPKDNTITCYVRLADLTGEPLYGRTVTIHNVFMPNSVTAQNKTWGVFRNYTTLTTDRDGYADVRLLRGATIDVNLGGTGYTRRIVLPDVGDLVNLLDPDLSTTDEFGIQTLNVDFAIRTS